MGCIKWLDYDCGLVYAPSEEDLINTIELAFRTCYNSVDKMVGESYKDKVKFITNKLDLGHGSPLEHINISIKAVIDRGILAEITRHRIGSSYSVSSTRYIKYKDKVPCIMPTNLRKDSVPDDIKRKFICAMENACSCYKELLNDGIAPQDARSLLPQGLGVELVETHNLREWEHIFALRYFGLTGKPHPDMIYWMHKIYVMFSNQYPNIFKYENRCKECDILINNYSEYMKDESIYY